MHILHTVQYISCGTDKENLFYSQESWGGDHLPHSRDLNERFKSDTERKNYMQVTLWD